LPLISQAVANSVAGVVWGLSSPIGQRNVQKTIERSVNRKYLPYMNALARGNRKSMHHLYEWNRVGITNARLFDLTVPPTSRGKANFSMKVTFRPSKSLVPLTEAQATPGPTGAVVQQKHIFYNKAMVMEYGQSVTIRPKTSKYLAFDTPVNAPYKSMSGLTFTSNPVIIKYAMRPNYHALQSATSAFFQGAGKQSIKEGVNGYTRRLVKNSGRAAVAIQVSVPSDEYANQMGRKVANSMVTAVPGD
jgi:hypothetical protein